MNQISKKYKILVFSLLTAVTAAVLLLLIFFTGSGIQAEKGTLNLTKGDFPYSGPVKLKGEWKIVFDEFLNENTASDSIDTYDIINVPGNWNRLKSPSGYATYMLQISVPENSEPLMLLMPSESTAFRLFINGRPAAENGKTGKSKQTSIPQYRYSLVEIGDHTGTIELMLHISNFHYAKGGMWTSPSIGTIEQIESHFYLRIFISTLLSGSLLMIGLCLTMLFLIKRKFNAYKNLGIFCLFMAFRTLLVGEIPLTHFFPGFPWTLNIRFEYLTMTLGFAFFNSYFYNLYKEFYNRRVFLIFQCLNLLFSLAILLFPVLYFTSLLKPIQILILAGIINGYVLFYLSGKQMKVENSILILGFTVIQIMVILDILLANNLITFIPIRMNTSVGLVIFVFANAVILMRLAVQTTQNLEQLTEGLEKMVELRTRELENVNRELFDKAITDTLTGINNRHEFTRVMKYEDARYRRSGNEYAALYLDLDNFKYINDTYGHAAGDLVLKLFASLLKSSSRDSDYLFRLGGDEFFILMTEIHSQKDARKLSDRILSDLNKKNFFLDDMQKFTGEKIKYPADKRFSVSIGISYSEISTPDSLHELLIQSDMALLDAKAIGKNRFSFFKPSTEKN